MDVCRAQRSASLVAFQAEIGCSDDLVMVVTYISIASELISQRGLLVTPTAAAAELGLRREGGGGG